MPPRRSSRTPAAVSSVAASSEPSSASKRTQKPKAKAKQQEQVQESTESQRKRHPKRKRGAKAEPEEEEAESKQSDDAAEDDEEGSAAMDEDNDDDASDSSDEPAPVFSGKLSSAGLKHGAGTLTFSDGSTLQGKWVNDELQGQGVYTASDGSRIEGTYLDGELDGLVVEYDPEGTVTFKGSYAKSLRHGEGSLFLPDGGELRGMFVQGSFEGDSNRFIYPSPFTTPAKVCALVGRWVGGVMKEARFEVDGVVSKHDRKTVYKFDESTSSSISTHPLLADPFESLTTFVAPSTIPDSGEGLFARENLKGGCIVAFYSGTREPGNKAERRRWEENSNTISLIDDDAEGEGEVDIDVPLKWSSTDSYRASLGHKVNHHCTPEKRNCIYDMCLHPRFGLIKAIRTTRDVEANEELFVDYGYTGRSGPEWYKKAMKQEKLKEKQKGEEKPATASKASSAEAGSSDAAAAASKSNKRRKR